MTFSFWRYREVWKWGQSDWKVETLPFNNDDGEVRIHFNRKVQALRQNDYFQAIEWEPLPPSKSLVKKAIKDRLLKISLVQKELDGLKRMLDGCGSKHQQVIMV